MGKFTNGQRMNIIPKLISQSEYAQQRGVNKAQFQYWLKLYDLHGEEGFKNTYTDYSVRFKLDVLKLHGSIRCVYNGHCSSF